MSIVDWDDYYKFYEFLPHLNEDSSFQKKIQGWYSQGPLTRTNFQTPLFLDFSLWVKNTLGVDGHDSQ